MATRFCTKCGTPLKENARFCPECGAPAPQPEPAPEPMFQQQTYTPQPAKAEPIGPKPKSFLALAILSTIFCCLPFGIVAIVQAAKVNSLWNSGFYEDAQNASTKARNWIIVAAIVGLVVSITYTVLVSKGIIALGDTLTNDYR